MDHILVMGIAGAGKTTLARALAAHLGAQFVDADDFHTDDARAKMQAGTPLTDADRAPWLARVKAYLNVNQQRKVLACSALKRAYRSTLGLPICVYVAIDPDLAAQRLQARHHHFVDSTLLASQLATLEIPQDGEARQIIRVDAAMTTSDQIAAFLDA